MIKAGQPLEIVVNKKIFGLANIITNLYVIWLTESQKLAIANRVTTLTFKIWDTQIGHLEYRSLLKLPKLTHGIEIKISASM